MLLLFLSHMVSKKAGSVVLSGIHERTPGNVISEILQSPLVSKSQEGWPDLRENLMQKVPRAAAASDKNIPIISASCQWRDAQIET